jgi:hypothetical protein
MSRQEWLRLSNGMVEVAIDPQNLRGTMRLLSTGDSWTLDILGTAGWLTEATAPNHGYHTTRTAEAPILEQLPEPEVMEIFYDEIRLIFARGDARLRAAIRLHPTEAAVTFSAVPQSWGPGAVSDLMFPGTIGQEGDRPLQLVLPERQGLLYTGEGEPFERYLEPRMRWWGAIGARSSYLAIIETADDKALWIAKDAQGQVQSKVRWLPSFGSLRYERRVTYHLLPERSHVALARRFRRYAQAHGLFRSMRDKMAERPILDRFIGAAHLYLGYLESPASDFVGAMRRLKAMGLERAYCFPLVMVNYGQRDPSSLASRGERWRDVHQLGAVIQDELGYICAPWMWNWEILPSSPHYRPELVMCTSDGVPVRGWSVDADTWEVVNQTVAHGELLRWEELYRDLRGAHFDVTTSLPPLEDYHPLHPSTRSGDARARAALFAAFARANRVVGSEGFWDWAAPHLDYGTTKLNTSYGDSNFWTIPLQHLVYHDSIVMAWWEQDGYNDPVWSGRGGQPVQQALQDVLYNDPPLLFPVGRSYHYLDRETDKRPGFREYNLDMPAVHDAVQRAIPVAALHRRFGLDEMLDHRFLDERGEAQQTTFSSGARISVNFGETEVGLEGGRTLGPLSWQVEE